MTPGATTLAYDRSLNRDGLSIDQSDGFFQVITPRIGNWRALGRHWIALIGVLAFLAAFPLLTALSMPKSERIGPLVASAEYGVFLAFAILAALTKLRQQYIFEIARDTFSVTRTEITGARRTWIYRRDAISDVHASAEPGRLIVHVRGQDMLDLYLWPDRSIPERVAEALNQGLRIPMGPRTADSNDVALYPDLSTRARKTRSILFVVAGLMGAAGILVGVAIHPALALLAWFAAAIPLGLAMGTQEKKFWV